MLFKKARPALIPPTISKDTTLPPLRICFLATSYCGCDFRKGYFTTLTLGCFSKNLATFNAFLQWRSTRTPKVSKLLDRTQALKGESAGPVFRENK